MKTHRVRLSDDEIKLIGEALAELFRKKDAEKADYWETRKIMDLARRFQEWGREERYQERPFYARRHR